MRKMMVGKENLVLGNAQLRLKGARHPELVDHPGDHGLPEYLPGLRIGLQHGRQDAIELAERLFKENDVVEIVPRNPARFKAVVNGFPGKIEVVLLARKSLLLGGRNKLAVANK